MKALIIGWGNSLRGDDGIGLMVADLLERRKVQADVRRSLQLLPEMCEEISRASQVIFIDASLTAAPGEITLEELQAGKTVLPDFSSHSLTPQALIDGALTLYGRAPKALICGIGANRFEGTSLSKQLLAAADEAAALIAKLLADAEEQ